MRHTVIDVFADSAPTWSPNGKKLAFIGRLPGSTRDGLMVANQNGTGWHTNQIADFDANSSSLSWTADGRLLIVSCLPPGGVPCASE